MEQVYATREIAKRKRLPKCRWCRELHTVNKSGICDVCWQRVLGKRK
jgi:hypothetical protein